MGWADHARNSIVWSKNSTTARYHALGRVGVKGTQGHFPGLPVGAGVEEVPGLLLQGTGGGGSGGSKCAEFGGTKWGLGVVGVLFGEVRLGEAPALGPHVIVHPHVLQSPIETMLRTTPRDSRVEFRHISS